jgi:hypothetical protein
MVSICGMVFTLTVDTGQGIRLETRATGTLPVIVQSPECCWTNLLQRAREKRFK